jgi:hypothetical protein
MMKINRVIAFILCAVSGLSFGSAEKVCFSIADKKYDYLFVGVAHAEPDRQFFNEICRAHGEDGNEQVEKFSWLALVRKDEHAINALNEIIEYKKAKSDVDYKKSAMCVQKGIGRQCLTQQLVARITAGLATAYSAFAAHRKSRNFISLNQRLAKEQRLSQVQGMAQQMMENGLIAPSKGVLQIVQSATNAEKLTELTRQGITLRRELSEMANASWGVEQSQQIKQARLAAGYKDASVQQKDLIDKSLQDQFYANGKIWSYVSGFLVIGAAGLLGYSVYQKYQSYQADKGWREFKAQPDDYHIELAKAFKEFLKDMNMP